MKTTGPDFVGPKFQQNSTELSFWVLASVEADASRALRLEAAGRDLLDVHPLKCDPLNPRVEREIQLCGEELLGDLEAYFRERPCLPGAALRQARFLAIPIRPPAFFGLYSKFDLKF